MCQINNNINQEQFSKNWWKTTLELDEMKLTNNPNDIIYDYVVRLSKINKRFTITILEAYGFPIVELMNNEDEEATEKWLNNLRKTDSKKYYELLQSLKSSIELFNKNSNLKRDINESIDNDNYKNFLSLLQANKNNIQGGYGEMIRFGVDNPEYQKELVDSILSQIKDSYSDSERVFGKELTDLAKKIHQSQGIEGDEFSAWKKQVGLDEIKLHSKVTSEMLKKAWGAWYFSNNTPEDVYIEWSKITKKYNYLGITYSDIDDWYNKNKNKANNFYLDIINFKQKYNKYINDFINEIKLMQAIKFTKEINVNLENLENKNIEEIIGIYNKLSVKFKIKDLEKLSREQINSVKWSTVRKKEEEHENELKKEILQIYEKKANEEYEKTHLEELEFNSKTGNPFSVRYYIEGIYDNIRNSVLWIGMSSRMVNVLNLFFRKLNIKDIWIINGRQLNDTPDYSINPKFSCIYFKFNNYPVIFYMGNNNFERKSYMFSPLGYISYNSLVKLMDTNIGYILDMLEVNKSKINELKLYSGSKNNFYPDKEYYIKHLFYDNKRDVEWWGENYDVFNKWFYKGTTTDNMDNNLKYLFSHSYYPDTYKQIDIKDGDKVISVEKWNKIRNLKQLEESILKDITQNIKDFVKFCVSELNLKQPINCKITLTKNKNKTKTYAHYDPNTGEIICYVKNRSLGDINRSICHELIHHSQNQLNQLSAESGDTGSEQENEANSKAGVIMRKWGELHPEIYVQSLNELNLISSNIPQLITPYFETLDNNEMKTWVYNWDEIKKLLLKLKLINKYTYGDVLDLMDMFIPKITDEEFGYESTSDITKLNAKIYQHIFNLSKGKINEIDLKPKRIPFGGESFADLRNKIKEALPDKLVSIEEWNEKGAINKGFFNYGSYYHDYVSFNFHVKDLNKDDEEIINKIIKNFNNRHHFVGTPSYQYNRVPNVWVTCSAPIITTNDRPIGESFSKDWWKITLELNELKLYNSSNQLKIPDSIRNLTQMSSDIDKKQAIIDFINKNPKVKNDLETTLKIYSIMKSYTDFNSFILGIINNMKEYNFLSEFPFNIAKILYELYRHLYRDILGTIDLALKLEKHNWILDLNEFEKSYYYEEYLKNQNK